MMAEEYSPDLKTRGVRSTRADIVIYENEEKKNNDYNAFIVVECKAEEVKIRLEDFYQGAEYAAKLRAQFLILHNSKETHFYAVDMEKAPNKRDAFTQIVTIPHYDDMEHIEKNTGKADVKEVLGKDILSQTLRVPADYIIYGKLRPYLNKYWINKDPLNNVICSSEFFVFNTQGINKRFFIICL